MVRITCVGGDDRSAQAGGRNMRRTATPRAIRPVPLRGSGSSIDTSSAVGIVPRRPDRILRTHLIDATSLRSEDFESFFASRFQALVDRISAAMGKPIARESVADGDAGEQVEFELDDAEA
jgi:hypothetical protein